MKNQQQKNASHKTPYLSVIVASRNDQVVALDKKVRFVNNLLQQTRKYGLSTELIIVEWNPPENQPLLKELLPKPDERHCLKIKHLVIPPEKHHQYQIAKHLSILTYIARNVGIRRAEGEYLLCTNMDILLSDALMEKISKKDLAANCFYRANKGVVPDRIKSSWTYHMTMEFCWNNITEQHGKNPKYPYIQKAPRYLYMTPFQPLAWMLNYIEKVRLWFSLSQPKFKFYANDLKEASDFILMHRDAWYKIYGYNQLDISNPYISELAIAVAASLGYEQYIFPAKECIYQIGERQKTQNAFDKKNPLEKIKLFEQMPFLGYEFVWHVFMDLFSNKNHSYSVNDSNWGYKDLNFEQHCYFNEHGFNHPESLQRDKLMAQLEELADFSRNIYNSIPHVSE